MIELYRKIKIPQFEIIKSEILKIVEPQISQNLRFWDIPFRDMYRFTPEFFKYLITNFCTIPIMIRCYNTPPYDSLIPHIDNFENAKNRIALNIPLYGTENTSMDYYITDEDNLSNTYTEGKSYLPVQVIKDLSKVTIIDSLELTTPHLVRTDIIHGIKNNKNSYRLIVSLKFIGSDFEDIIKKI